MSSKSVLQHAGATILRTGKTQFKLQSNIRISKISGLAAPYWAWNNLNEMKKNVYAGCAYLAQGVYDRTTYTQAAARSMVVYETTTGDNAYIPYGMTTEESAPIYEYVFKFPGEGVELAGNNNPNLDLTTAGISIALPAFDGWENMKVEVHVDMYDKFKKTYVAGIIKKEDHQSGTFNLEELDLWDGDKMSQLPEVSFKIDDDYFTPVSTFEVSSSKDFYDLVKGSLTNNDTSIPVNLDVTPTGYGIVVGNDVVKLIDDYRADYGKDKLTVKFNAGAEVTLAATNSISKFKYNGANVILAADQTIGEDVTGISSLKNESNVTLTVAKGNLATTVVNEGTMIVTCTNTEDGWKYGTVTAIDNYNNLSLNSSGTIDTVNNHPSAKMTASGASTVSELNNKKYHDCSNNCTVAELNVTGKLNVKTMTNDGKLKVAKNAELVVRTTLTNNYGGHKKNEFVEVFGKITVDNGATFTNKGYLNIGNTGGESGTVTAVVNENIVNLYGGKITGFDNEQSGDLYVYSEAVEVQSERNSNGEIYFEGVAPQGVGTLGQDNRIYKTDKSMTSKELQNAQLATGFRNLWVYNDITITKVEGAHEWSYENRALLENIVVKYQDAVRDIYLKAEKMANYAVTFENAKLTVESGMTLHVENNLKLTVKEYEGAVHAGTNSEVVGESLNPAVDHNQIVVTTADELVAALTEVTEGGVVRLNADITLESYLNIGKSMTLDLNGKKLSRETTGAEQPVVYVNGSAELIITGEGTVQTDNSNAVWTAGSSKVIIKNGSFINCTIFADGTSEIVVEGGYFEGGKDEETFGGQYTALNKRDNSKAVIQVKGGSFKNFNPAVNGSEGNPTNFLASGYRVKVKNLVNGEDETAEKADEKYLITWNQARLYSVVAK